MIHRRETFVFNAFICVFALFQGKLALQTLLYTLICRGLGRYVETVRLGLV